MNKIGFVVSFLVLGCASSSPNTPVSSPSSGGGSPDVAQVSSGGGGVPCAQEIALECPDGIDGCLKNQTSIHVCISTTAQAGPSCSQEIALECPAGDVDACALAPAAAANHICVRQ